MSAESAPTPEGSGHGGIPPAELIGPGENSPVTPEEMATASNEAGQAIHEEQMNEIIEDANAQVAEDAAADAWKYPDGEVPPHGLASYTEMQAEHELMKDAVHELNAEEAEVPDLSVNEKTPDLAAEPVLETTPKSASEQLEELFGGPESEETGPESVQEVSVDEAREAENDRISQLRGEFFTEGSYEIGGSEKEQTQNELAPRSRSARGVPLSSRLSGGGRHESASRTAETTTKYEACPKCKGSGRRFWVVRCWTCGGSGHVPTSMTHKVTEKTPMKSSGSLL